MTLISRSWLCVAAPAAGVSLPVAETAEPASNHAVAITATLGWGKSRGPAAWRYRVSSATTLDLHMEGSMQASTAATLRHPAMEGSYQLPDTAAKRPVGIGAPALRILIQPQA